MREIARAVAAGMISLEMAAQLRAARPAEPGTLLGFPIVYVDDDPALRDSSLVILAPVRFRA